MEKKSKNLLILLLFGLVFLGVSTLIYIERFKKDNVIVKNSFCVDTLVVRDTQFIDKSIVVYKPSLREEISDGMLHKKIYSDTIKTDSDKISYTAVISDNKLDSIRFNVTYPRLTDSIYITKTITETKYKKGKLLTINPSIGVGYGVLNKRPDIYVGVSLSINLFQR